MGRRAIPELDKVPTKNFNIKFIEEDAKILIMIAENYGISISALIRILVLSKLKKFEISNSLSDLFD